MTNTSTHPWTVNGTRLDTLANNIETKDGWVNISGHRGANAVVPGRHGEIWTPNKRHEPGSVVLSMWVSHTDANGSLVGSDPYFQWRKNFDALVALFDSNYGLLDVRQQYGPSAVTDVRQAFCEVDAVITPEFFGNQFGKFKVGLLIPDVFWQDVATQDFSSPTNAGALATHSVSTLTGLTAPVEDAIVQVIGPITNPKVIDMRTGHYVQLNFTVPSGQTWEFDCDKWTSVVGTNPAFAGTGTNKTDVTVSSGIHDPRLFAIAPSVALATAPTVRLEGTGNGTLTQLKIRARRKFK